MGVRYEYNRLLRINSIESRTSSGAISQRLINGQLTTPDGQRIVIPAGGRAPRGLVYVGDPDSVLGDTIPVGGVAPDKNNFAPRVGFAWSLGSSENGFLKRLMVKIRP